jgi:hypothetical protein
MSFDEAYDEMLHDEFRPREATRGKHAAPETPDEEQEGPRGLARFRTAGLVGAGGLACAAVGAFLGGLGGYFTINPAAAHSVASSRGPSQSLAAAVNQAYRATPATSGPAAVTAASISDLSGSVTQRIGPTDSRSAALPGDAPVEGLPLGTPWTSGGNGTTGGGSGVGSGTGCTTTQSDLGLSCILDSISSSLVNLGTLPGAGTGSPLGGLAPTLAGVVSNITGTLSNLGSLVAVSSAPLPADGVPSVGLGGLVPGSTSSPTRPGGGGQTPSPTLSGLGAVLNGVAATVGGAAPSLPSLPLPSGGSVPTVPSLPVTTTTLPLPAPPTVGAPGAPGGSITVPLPPLPVPLPTLTIGGISIGGNTLILP